MVVLQGSLSDAACWLGPVMCAGVGALSDAASSTRDSLVSDVQRAASSVGSQAGGDVSRGLTEAAESVDASSTSLGNKVLWGALIVGGGVIAAAVIFSSRRRSRRR